MKKLFATLLTISTLFVMGGYNSVSADEISDDFNLINYLETHEIDSYEEFIDIIEVVSPESIDENEDTSNIELCNIEIDYDSMTVSVLTMEESISGRAYGASNNATKSYYTSSGIKIFTIYIEGTFKYSSGSCSTISCSGNLTKPIYSLWTSTPTISSGNITTKKAYARISGTATSGASSVTYSLTLTCDDSGNFSSY